MRTVALFVQAMPVIDATDVKPSASRFPPMILVYVPQRER